jgi:hypothetical protein
MPCARASMPWYAKHSVLVPALISCIFSFFLIQKKISSQFGRCAKSRPVPNYSEFGNSVIAVIRSKTQRS